MNTKKLDRVYCDDLKEYQVLREDASFFQKGGNPEIFIMAMAMGFKKGIKTPLKKGKEGVVRLTYFKEEHISMIKAIAVIDAKSAEILSDEEKIYSIAEEYANTGIKLLKPLLISTDSVSYIKKLASELLENIKDNNVSTSK